jgi:hypothetical protein
MGLRTQHTSTYLPMVPLIYQPDSLPTYLPSPPLVTPRQEAGAYMTMTALKFGRATAVETVRKVEDLVDQSSKIEQNRIHHPA